MSNLPRLTGREFRTWDWYGWIMSILGLILIYHWSRDNTLSWGQKIALVTTVSWFTLDYFWRVCYGRVYKHVYYDTIIHKMYEIDINGENYYICSENEDELREYIAAHYPFIGYQYKIINESDVESYIKQENFK